MNIQNLIQFTPDSSGYVGYADIITKSTEWLNQVDLSTIDVTLHRLPLYPLLIAICKFIFGQHWGYALISLQFLSFLWSAFLIYQLCCGLKFKKMSMWVALIGYTTGLPLLFSLYVLTDGLYTSLCISIICSICLRGINSRDKLTNTILLTTYIFLVSFLRETTLYFMVTLLPLMLIPFFHKKYKEGIITLVVCFLPVISVQESLKQWNIYRCDARIITSGTATALIVPHIELINAYPRTIEYSVLKKHLPDKRPLEFQDGVSAICSLMKTQNTNILELQKLVEHDYFKLFRLFPRQQIHLLVNRAGRDIFLVNFNPMYTLAQIIDPSDTELPRLSKIRDCFNEGVNFKALLYIFAVNACRLFSLFLCLFGFYKLGKRIFYKNFNNQTLVLTGMLLHALGWIFVYSLVHVEIRYIATSVVMFLIIGCVPGSKDEKYLKSQPLPT